MQQIRTFLAFAATSLTVCASTIVAQPVSPAMSGTSLDKISPASNRLAARDNIHYFTITLPETSAKRFARLSFSFTDPQRNNGVAPIRFNLLETKAFVGRPGAIAQMVDIQSIWIDETGTVWLEFKPSVTPKTTLTVVLETQKTSSPAVYQYGIAAYPDTQLPVPVFVSDGTLTIR